MYVYGTPVEIIGLGCTPDLTSPALLDMASFPYCTGQANWILSVQEFSTSHAQMEGTLLSSQVSASLFKKEIIFSPRIPFEILVYLVILVKVKIFKLLSLSFFLFSFVFASMHLSSHYFLLS